MADIRLDFQDHQRKEEEDAMKRKNEMKVIGNLWDIDVFHLLFVVEALLQRTNDKSGKK